MESKTKYRSKEQQQDEQSSEIDASLSYESSFPIAETKSKISRVPLLDIGLSFAKEMQQCLILHIYHPRGGEFNAEWNNAIEKIQNNVTILGWNIENTKYHLSLIKALNRYPELSKYACYIQQEMSTAILLKWDNGKLLSQDLFSNLSNDNVETESESCAIMDPTSIQQHLCDMFGIITFVCFKDAAKDGDDTERTKLHQKIYLAFNIFSQNSDSMNLEDIDNDEQSKNILQAITRESRKVTPDEDITIGIIYNCFELCSDGNKKSAKDDNNKVSINEDSNNKPANDDSNSKSDNPKEGCIGMVPIFILRKCIDSEKSLRNNLCRVFIDHTGRTYKSWTDYVSNVRLPKCTMFLPKNGCYVVDDDGNVILEKLPSPSCSLAAKVCKYTDIASTIASTAATGILICNPIAAPLVIGASVTAIATGAYSLSRSAAEIHDRRTHGEDMSFRNSEARGAYLNLVSGSLEICGAGATKVLSKMASKGVNISRITKNVVNGISISKLVVNGVSVSDSVIGSYMHYKQTNELPSTLTVVQMSAAVLFFANAVYMFKSSNRIILEVQESTLKDQMQGISKRKGKLLTKMHRESIRLANGDIQQGSREVIAHLRNIPDTESFFSTISRNNNVFKKNGVQFGISNGKVVLNGVPIDMTILASMDRVDLKNYIQTLPTLNRSANFTQKLPTFTSYMTFNSHIIPKAADFLLHLNQNGLEDCVKNILISVINDFIERVKNDVISSAVQENFENVNQSLTQCVIFFIRNCIDNLPQLYKEWKKNGKSDFADIFSKYDRQTFDDLNWVKGVELIFGIMFADENVRRKLLEDLWIFFHTWFVSYTNNEFHQSRNESKSISFKDNLWTECEICCGRYYDSKKK